MSEKTEDPTPGRLQKARREGNVAVSAELASAVAMVVALALVPAAVTATALGFRQGLGRALAAPDAWSPWGLASAVLAQAAPLILAVAAAATATGLVQTGFLLSPARLKVDLSRLNPAQGVKRLVSPERLFGVIRGLVGALLVAYLAVRLLWLSAGSVANTTGDARLATALAGAVLQPLTWTAALVVLALAGVDLLLVRRSWWRKLRMSKDEVKREHKESDGDPELKAARQRAHQEMLQQATLAAVRKASVVVVNPTHLACALSYDAADDGAGAPTLVASGRGELARQMVDAARAYGVPVVRDVPVARALIDLDIGDEIPESLYEAVAEVLREAWGEDDRGDPSVA